MTAPEQNVGIVSGESHTCKGCARGSYVRTSTKPSNSSGNRPTKERRRLSDIS